MKVVPSSDALADLVRLRNFLHADSPAAAARASKVLVAAIQTLADLPHRGRSVGDAGMRELVTPFGGSAYVIRYVVDETRSEVVVVRIWHGREARS